MIRAVQEPSPDVCRYHTAIDQSGDSRWITVTRVGTVELLSATQAGGLGNTASALTSPRSRSRERPLKCR
jgi:hypothetical protein